MKKLFLLPLLILSLQLSYLQGKEPDKKELTNTKILSGINDTTCVFKAKQVFIKGRYRSDIGENNLVLFKKNKVIVQFDGIQTDFNSQVAPKGLGNSMVYHNGAGGATLEGYLKKYEIAEDKKGRKQINAYSSGGSLAANINVIFHPNNSAIVTISFNSSNNRIVFKGSIHNIEDTMYVVYPAKK
ncbi:DUF4251 domain-containing protein [Prolixibacteraceae bacterium JC049]|nr:DUF4251 domain-containing protein [Prolixibacteraceae bacterium JC049]